MAEKSCKNPEDPDDQADYYIEQYGKSKKHDFCFSDSLLGSQSNANGIARAEIATPALMKEWFSKLRPYAIGPQPRSVNTNATFSCISVRLFSCLYVAFCGNLIAVGLWVRLLHAHDRFRCPCHSSLSPYRAQQKKRRQNCSMQPSTGDSRWLDSTDFGVWCTLTRFSCAWRNQRNPRT